MKRPWVFIRAPYKDPNVWGVIRGPGWLSQILTFFLGSIRETASRGPSEPYFCLS